MNKPEPKMRCSTVKRHGLGDAPVHVTRGSHQRQNDEYLRHIAARHAAQKHGTQKAGEAKTKLMTIRQRRLRISQTMAASQPKHPAQADSQPCHPASTFTVRTATFRQTCGQSDSFGGGHAGYGGRSFLDNLLRLEDRREFFQPGPQPGTSRRSLHCGATLQRQLIRYQASFTDSSWCITVGTRRAPKSDRTTLTTSLANGLPDGGC